MTPEEHAESARMWNLLAWIFALVPLSWVVLFAVFLWIVTHD